MHDGVTLARRPTGGGCVYRDLGDTGFSFMNPHASFEDQRDFRTMNNDVLLDALAGSILHSSGWQAVNWMIFPALALILVPLLWQAAREPVRPSPG